MTIELAAGLFVLALVVGVYGSITGAGGGFLMVAGLVLVFDLSGAEAVGTSVITTVVIQLVAAGTYARDDLIDRPTAQWFVLGSIPVAFLSAAILANRIPERTFNLIIGVLLVGLAVFVLARRAHESGGHQSEPPRKSALVGLGSAMGVLSGAFGVGAGLVTVPAIRSLQKLSTHRAAATTTAIGAASGVAASIGHAVAGNPRWSYAPFVIAGAVFGGRLGARSANRVAPQLVGTLLAAGLLATGVPLLAAAI